MAAMMQIQPTLFSNGSLMSYPSYEDSPVAEDEITFARAAAPVVLRWIRSNYELAEGFVISRREVYEDYKQYCSLSNTKAVAQPILGKLLRQVFPDIKVRRIGSRKASTYHYIGIRRMTSAHPVELKDNPFSQQYLPADDDIPSPNAAAVPLPITVDLLNAFDCVFSDPENEGTDHLSADALLSTFSASAEQFSSGPSASLQTNNSYNGYNNNNNTASYSLQPSSTTPAVPLSTLSMATSMSITASSLSSPSLPLPPAKRPRVEASTTTAQTPSCNFPPTTSHQCHHSAPNSSTTALLGELLETARPAALLSLQSFRFPSFVLPPFYLSHPALASDRNAHQFAHQYRVHMQETLERLVELRLDQISIGATRFWESMPYTLAQLLQRNDFVAELAAYDQLILSLTAARILPDPLAEDIPAAALVALRRFFAVLDTKLVEFMRSVPFEVTTVRVTVMKRCLISPILMRISLAVMANRVRQLLVDTRCLTWMQVAWQNAIGRDQTTGGAYGSGAHTISLLLPSADQRLLAGVLLEFGESLMAASPASPPRLRDMLQIFAKYEQSGAMPLQNAARELQRLCTLLMQEMTVTATTMAVMSPSYAYDDSGDQELEMGRQALHTLLLFTAQYLAVVSGADAVHC